MVLNNPIIITTLVTVATNICTYFVTRRKKQNDFISDLQKSIDLLSDRYSKTLNELVIVRETNLQLTTKVNELILENKKLKNEIASLSNRINCAV